MSFPPKMNIKTVQAIQIHQPALLLSLSKRPLSGYDERIQQCKPDGISKKAVAGQFVFHVITVTQHCHPS
jgi:hypothetical protein